MSLGCYPWKDFEWTPMVMLPMEKVVRWMKNHHKPTNEKRLTRPHPYIVYAELYMCVSTNAHMVKGCLDNMAGTRVLKPHWFLLNSDIVALSLSLSLSLSLRRVCFSLPGTQDGTQDDSRSRSILQRWHLCVFLGFHFKKSYFSDNPHWLTIGNCGLTA